MFCKKVALKCLAKLIGKKNVMETFLLMMQALVWNFTYKNSPPQVLSCQFCESFKNSCSIEYPRATAFYLPVLIHRYN